jgi:hypothetical protein
MTIIGNYFLKHYPSITTNHPDWVDKLVWLDTMIQPSYYNDGKPYDRSTTGMFLEWRSKDKESWVYKIYGMPTKLKVTFADDKDKVLYYLRWL